MLFFNKRKDGGKKSNVTGYWLVELKGLFSIVLLKFSPGSRENYHSHAFNAYTWYLGGGKLIEDRKYKDKHKLTQYKRSIFPKYTPKENLHRVINESDKSAWAFCIRGPWDKTWLEYNKDKDEFITLTNGRKVVK